MREFDFGMFTGFAAAGVADLVFGRGAAGMGHILGGGLLLLVVTVYYKWVKA